MFELLVTLIFLWLLGKSLGLVFRLTWSAAKCIAVLLLVAAFPLLLLGLCFAGGILLLIPLAVIGTAAALLNACVRPGT